MHKKLILPLYLLLILCSACSGLSSGPEDELIGSWVFMEQRGGNTMFFRDLIFQEGNKLKFPANGFFEENSAEYIVVAPGRLKLTIDHQVMAVNYSLDQDQLRLIFDEGDILYQREENLEVSAVIETEREEIDVPPENTLAPTLTPPDIPSVVETKVPTAKPSPTGAPEATQNNHEDLEPTPTPVFYYPLANCVGSHLHVGDSAFISYTGGKNFLRRTADTHPSTNIISDIFPGEVIELIDGPECNYGWLLWKVRTTHNQVGWTAETDGEEFWIFPITTSQACLGALPSRVVVGQQAKVMEEPPVANSVRNAPNKSADVIDKIQSGDLMLILDGPSCNDGSTWWKVKSLTTQKTGWTREGNASSYYIAPIP